MHLYYFRILQELIELPFPTIRKRFLLNPYYIVSPNFLHKKALTTISGLFQLKPN